MSHVIHKFLIDPRLIGKPFELALLPGARVLYFDRDSRTKQVAVWVMQRALRLNQAPTDLIHRRFLVVSTGHEFTVDPASLTSLGLVRIDTSLFHAFEIGEIAEHRMARHGCTIEEEAQVTAKLERAFADKTRVAMHDGRQPFSNLDHSRQCQHCKRWGLESGGVCPNCKGVS